MRIKNKKLKLILVSSIFLLISLAVVVNVSAAATVTPSTQSGLINMPATFTANGLDSTGSEEYSIKLGGVEVLSGLYANSQGQLQFQVTPSIAGTLTVGVYNSTPLLVASASLVATDLFAVIVPVMVLFIGLSILFGIAKEMGKI